MQLTKKNGNFSQLICLTEHGILENSCLLQILNFLTKLLLNDFREDLGFVKLIRLDLSVLGEMVFVKCCKVQTELAVLLMTGVWLRKWDIFNFFCRFHSGAILTTVVQTI